MSKVNPSRGNMYDWVTHTWSPGRGCSHQCEYCYVKDFGGQPTHTKFDYPFPPLGKHRSIFVGHLCDLFAKDVPTEDIQRVLEYCARFPNIYIFQTKNPGRLYGGLGYPEGGDTWKVPDNSRIGTTIETDREELIKQYSKAPDIWSRIEGIYQLALLGYKTFITIEPIMDFSRDFAKVIIGALPGQVNIGADSKGHYLPEPTNVNIETLVKTLREAGIKVKIKSNLGRLCGAGK